MNFLRELLRNLLTILLIVVGVCFGMYVFARIFYPETLSIFPLMFQATGQIISAFKLGPIVILMLLLAWLRAAWPRRKR